MRALLPIIFALAATSVLGAPDASPAGSKSFSGWTATCNNLGACVAIGTAQEEDLFYLRIARNAGAAAAPEVKVVLASQSDLKGKAPAFRLDAIADGKAESLGAYPATMSAPFTARLPDGEASAAFVDKIRNATTLGYALLGAKGTLDLKGLSAALRWIDARQGRAGTPTALVAKGMTPIGQVPPPRPAPVIVAGKPEGVAEIGKPILSPALMRQAMAQDICEKDVVRAHKDTQAWRLAPDLVLIAVPCLQGAYQGSAALYFTNAKGEAPRPVSLPKETAGDGQSAANIVTNVEFDPATLVLAHFGKGRGIADCGDSRSWVWTGRRFDLLEATALEVCPGAIPDDWPSIYSAVRK